MAPIEKHPYKRDQKSQNQHDKPNWTNYHYRRKFPNLPHIRDGLLDVKNPHRRQIRNLSRNHSGGKRHNHRFLLAFFVILRINDFTAKKVFYQKINIILEIILFQLIYLIIIKIQENVF